MAAKKKITPVEVSYKGIYDAVCARVSGATFLCDTATQITLKGALEASPLYVKVEDLKAVVAPYEYVGAPFYIDCDAAAFASVLSGSMSFYEALASGAITVNGDAAAALLFVHALF